jgi:hypothetical protein
MTARLRLADLLARLSLAADLGFALPAGQAVRSCVIGASLTWKLGLPERDAGAVFHTELLHQIGCTASPTRRRAHSATSWR